MANSLRFRTGEEARNWGHVFDKALEAEFRIVGTNGETGSAVGFAARAADEAILQLRLRSGQSLLDEDPAKYDDPMPTDADAPPDA